MGGLASEIRYFADENALGLARVLEERGRTDFVYPGHPTLPAVPLGSADLDWIPKVAALGLIVLTRERRMRSRPAEAAVLRSAGLRVVRLGAKRDMGSADLADLFEMHEQRLERLVVKHGAGPWFARMTPSGVYVLPQATHTPRGGH
jgi:hypothetical protein